MFSLPASFTALTDREQTCLAAILVLSFSLGVVSVGALYRLILARTVPEEPRLRALRAAGQAGELTRDLAVGDAPALRLIGLLIRYALSWGPRV